MRFWTWALEAYARPGAAEACLDLQDGHGQCVPYLLWAAWAAREGRALDSRTLRAGAELSAHWEAAAVGPLRAARRAMKSPVPGVAEAAREALRAEVKTLEALAPEANGGALTIGPALAAAATAWRWDAPQSALERLVQTLS